MCKLLLNFHWTIKAWLLIIICSSCIASLEYELTFTVEARKRDCYYQNVSELNTIDLEYQVIDGGYDDFDINFETVNPLGRILVGDMRKSENLHKIVADVTGDYKFCFDNTLSAFNAKTIFVELLIYASADTNQWDAKDESINKLTQDYQISADNILDTLSNVKNDFNKIGRVQEIIKSTEARDRNIAEGNYYLVNVFSCMQIVIMLVSGIVQVVVVKNLFATQL